MSKTKPEYNLILNETSLKELIDYKNALIEGHEQPGAYLKEKLGNQDLSAMSNEKFLEALLSTKQPRIFVELSVQGKGLDWNHKELKLLGDVNVAVNVEVHDNGVWSTTDPNLKTHDKPFKGNLLFTPGVLLNGIAGLEGKPIDYDEVTTNGKIDQKKYDSLIEKRLLPLLAHVNETASNEGKPAVITMPGIGCGNFAGEFYGKMATHLDLAMQNMLKKHEKKFPNIACIYYDPYNEVENTEKNIGGIKYQVRPSEQTPDGQDKKPQLLPPEQYEEKKGEFKNCTLYKIVAWDHVSLPGNDFYESNTRNTDDGVVAAATNVLQKITGIEDKYNKDDMMYLPPAGYRDWEQVARKIIFTLSLIITLKLL